MRQNAEIRDTRGCSLFIQSFIFQWQLTSKVKGMMGNRTDSGKGSAIHKKVMIYFVSNDTLIFFFFFFKLLLSVCGSSSMENLWRGQVRISHSLFPWLRISHKLFLSNLILAFFFHNIFLKEMKVRTHCDWAPEVCVTSDQEVSGWKVQKSSVSLSKDFRLLRLPVFKTVPRERRICPSLNFSGAFSNPVYSKTLNCIHSP